MMAEQLDLGTFTGPHPTAVQLVEQLQAWGFRQRRPHQGRTDGVHLVFRGPQGGTLRVLRSLLGRADADVVAKAARLLGVDPWMFWAGPTTEAGQLASLRSSDDRPTTSERGPAVHDATTSHGAGASAMAAATAEGGSRGVGPADPRDRNIAQVLAVHVAMDQPLSLGQVVQLCDEHLTRAQVSAASSRLCRDGQLVRVRSGVYQWAEGTYARQGFTRRPDQTLPPARERHDRSHPTTSPTALPPTTPSSTTTPAPRRPVSVALFAQMFPDGVQMTADLLGDLEQWAQLTEKLAAQTIAS